MGVAWDLVSSDVSLVTPSPPEPSEACLSRTFAILIEIILRIFQLSIVDFCALQVKFANFLLHGNISLYDFLKTINHTLFELNIM